MSFKNKVVLITGGSSGIGAAAAVLFAKEGANVVIVARNEAKLKKVSDEITKVGEKPLVIKADLSKEDESRTIVKKTVEKFGKLDVLVNNAGIVRYATVADENCLQAYDEIMNLNLRATIIITNLSIPYLVKTKGNIVNISSISGTTLLSDNNYSSFAFYSISKAAMDHYTRWTAKELADKGVRVNAISPGPVKTDIFENSGTAMDWDKMANQSPLKILPQPEEVADLIIYLASEKAKSITASNYVIDSGYIIS